VKWWIKSRRAQNDKDYKTWVEGAVMNTLNAFENMNESRATAIIFQAHMSGELRVQNETVQTLTAAMGTGGNNTPLMSEGSVVRRLTPVECERLQGFPDGWTEGQTDGHRYKQIGNAVAVPVVEWIMERLVACDKMV
jgi:DNA (cytosine-5)-methyltransferase 1